MTRRRGIIHDLFLLISFPKFLVLSFVFLFAASSFAARIDTSLCVKLLGREATDAAFGRVNAAVRAQNEKAAREKAWARATLDLQFSAYVADPKKRSNQNQIESARAKIHRQMGEICQAWARAAREPTYPGNCGAENLSNLRKQVLGARTVFWENQNDSNIPTGDGPELWQRVSFLRIRGGYIISRLGTTGPVYGIQREFQFRLYELASQRFTSSAAFLAQAQSLVDELAAALEREFPLSHHQSHANAAEAIRRSKVPVHSVLDRARAYDDIRGQPTLQVSNLGLQARFEPEIGTTLLARSFDSEPYQAGPVFVLGPGAGSNLSTIATTAPQIGIFDQEGFVGLATDGPLAGLGIQDATDFAAITVYAQTRARWIRDRWVDSNPLRPPLVEFGRSFGSLVSLGERLLFGDTENAADASIMTATANPYTMPNQVADLTRLSREGILRIDEGHVRMAQEYARDLILTIEKAKREHPQDFELAGHTSLFIEGEADSQGGPHSIAELKRWQDQFSPLGSVYVLPNPLKSYRGLNFYSIYNHLEANHFLLRPGPNLTPSQAARIMPMIRPEDYPKIADQRIEVIGLIWRYFDHLAESTLPIPSAETARLRFGEYRSRYLAATGCLGQTFFSCYLRSQNLTQADLALAVPGRQSVAGRLRRVDDFIKAEELRKAEHVSRIRGATP